MNKGVVAGAGLGLVLLAFLGGYWLANNGSAPTVGSPSAPPPVTAPGTDGGATAGAASSRAAAPSAPAMPPPSAAVPAQSGTVAPVPGAAGAPSAAPVAGGSMLTPEERRQLRASIRAKLAALQAKGPNVSIADAQARDGRGRAAGPWRVRSPLLQGRTAPIGWCARRSACCAAPSAGWTCPRAAFSR